MGVNDTDILALRLFIIYQVFGDNQSLVGQYLRYLRSSQYQPSSLNCH